MKKVTKRTLKTQFICIAILLGMLISSPITAKMPAKIERKIDKYLKSYLKTKDFVRIAIHIDEDKMETLDFDCYRNQLFDVKVKGESVGFLFIDKARSRYDDFTFMVFLNYDLSVKLVRVLEYNEIHGVEISNKGWLSQFIGFNPESKIKYLDNVDAISGATISSRSITVAIGDLLQKVKKLKAAEII